MKSGKEGNFQSFLACLLGGQDGGSQHQYGVTLFLAMANMPKELNKVKRKMHRMFTIEPNVTSLNEYNVGVASWRFRQLYGTAPMNKFGVRKPDELQKMKRDMRQ